MQAYREAFGEGETRLVLTPNSEFFRYFRESPAGMEAPRPEEQAPQPAANTEAASNPPPAAPAAAPAVR
jgi:membrane protease subunit HflC